MQTFFAADIGGTSAKCALVGADGSLSRLDGFVTGPLMTAEELAERLCGAAASAVAAGAAGIGLSCLGWIDPRTGVCTGGADHLPALRGLCLPRLLQERFGLPVCVHNDVDAMALGEHRFGAARGCGSFVAIALGTGIGGAIMLDGRLWQGAHHRAGELGYLRWRADGSCLEERTSALAMVREAGEALRRPQLDGKAFFQLVREENPVCGHVLRKHMGLLGACIADLVIALDVERVVIGGGVSSAGDVLIPVLREETDACLPPEMRGQYHVTAALRGNDAALLGAVCEWMENA